MKYRVASVPYLNAKPLVKPLEWLGDKSPVHVDYRVPSQLPDLLESKTVEAIMVSSIFALSNPGLTVAAELSISTQNEVQSVRLFSRVPFKSIETVAWDASSLTSNALTQILLSENFGIRPGGVHLPPEQGRMLSACDACVMIGDAGMAGHSQDLYVMDLGSEWRRLTGLPFVWAMWVGREDLKPELVAELQWSHEASWPQLDRVVSEASAETGFTSDQCRYYFTKIMDYGLGSKHLEGLRSFGEKAHELGLIKRLYPIQLIQAPISAIR